MKTENWGEFIKRNVPILEYIERFESLQAESNGEFVGGHSTHTSESSRCLKVNPEKGVCHCYNCGMSGSVIDYAMDLLGVDFIEACESITETMGLQLPTDDWTEAERQTYQTKRRQDIGTLKLLNLAVDYYHEQITPAAKDYFQSRGFRDETIATQKLGYAPGDDGLKKLLYNAVKQADPESTDDDIHQQLLDTGLYLQQDDGKLKPVFRNRYIFPYWRSRQQIGYMIGRNAAKSDTYATREGETRQIPKYKKLNTKSADGTTELPIARHHTLWGAHLLRKDGNPIVVTEGIVDAILLTQELGDHFQVVSPVTTRINSADIDRVIKRIWNWSRCVVTLIFCNDTEKSGAGAGGALDTAEKLQEAWQRRIRAERSKYKESNQQPPDRPTLLLKIAILPCPPERDKIDVADYVEIEQVAELEYWLHSAQNLAYHHAKARNDPNRFFEKRTFKPKLLADEIRQQGRYFMFTSGLLCEYHGGVYRESENDIRADIQDLLWDSSTDAHVQNVIKHISNLSFVAPRDIATTDKLNCRNGILDVETLELRPHSPYVKSLIQVSADWNPKAKSPIIDRFLSQILPEDCQDLIREVIGYTLMQSNCYEKAVLMVGSGSNGKTTFLNLLRTLLGAENYVSKSPKVLEENRFATASLFGKLANISGDIPAKRLYDTSILKQITSQDVIDAERKNKPSFQFDNFATNFFSANELPPTNDRTYGFYRRWLVIPFTYQIPDGEKDPTIGDKLTTPDELSGLLLQAVAGQKRLRVQKGFLNPETVNDALMEFQLQNDSVLRFVTDEVDTDDPEAVSNRSDVYDTYRAYCDDEGVKPVSQIAFNKSLRENKVALPTNNSRPRKWKGISVKNSEFYSNNS